MTLNNTYTLHVLRGKPGQVPLFPSQILLDRREIKPPLTCNFFHYNHKHIYRDNYRRYEIQKDFFRTDRLVINIV